MICPYCNCEMEKGFIDQARITIPVYWYPAERERGFFKSVKRDIKITSPFDSTPAYYCKDCRKLIIDQDDLPQKKK